MRVSSRWLHSMMKIIMKCDPPSTSLIPSRSELNHVPPPKAQASITNNWSSEFASKLEPPTFEQNLKSIKKIIKPTIDLYFRLQTIDILKKPIEKSSRTQWVIAHIARKDRTTQKVTSVAKIISNGKRVRTLGRSLVL